MATTETTCWAEVGERLRALALKLQLHAEEEMADMTDAADTAKPCIGAFDRFAEALRTTVDTITDAVKDPAIHADVRDAGQAFADAVHNSLAARRPAA